MTSKEPSINEEYTESQHQDENSSASIASTDTKKNESLCIIKQESTSGKKTQKVYTTKRGKEFMIKQ